MVNTNTYELRGTEAIIHTRSGKDILIDAEDAELLQPFSWCIEGTGYAMSRSHGRAIKLHRLILSAPVGTHVDHINGDKLDNRKANLRLCEKQQNEFNTRVRSDSKTGYKGVCWCRKKNRYRAYITRSGHQKHLGYYFSPEEAALAYNRAASELFGEFARLNEVKT